MRRLVTLSAVLLPTLILVLLCAPFLFLLVGAARCTSSLREETVTRRAQARAALLRALWDGKGPVERAGRGLFGGDWFLRAELGDDGGLTLIYDAWGGPTHWQEIAGDVAPSEDGEARSQMRVVLRDRDGDGAPDAYAGPVFYREGDPPPDPLTRGVPRPISGALAPRLGAMWDDGLVILGTPLAQTTSPGR